MTAGWAAPFFSAAALGLVATPIARNLALANHLVDRPAPRKSHQRVTPYLGGVAIAVATVGGYLTSGGTRLGAVVIVCASVLLVMGLVDDCRTVHPVVRLAIEAIAATVAVAAGVRLGALAPPGFTLGATVMLLVVVTNSMNLLDNADGLSAGVTAVAACSTLAMAVMLGQAAPTAVSASLVGACLAFLVFNAKPASIFMGDAGSLFLGFVLTATVIRVGSMLAGPAEWVFPALVAGLPLADTATVVVARLRNRRPITSGGRDHLSHRLARAGLGLSKAVALLVAVEGAMATLAVLMGDGTIPWGVALASGLVVLLGLVGVAGRVRVYHRRPPTLPRWVPWGLAGAFVALGLLSVPALIAGLRARSPALAGEVAAEQALSAARAGHLRTAAEDFRTARTAFASAQHDLCAPLVSVGLVYPVLSSNLRAARTLADVGLQLSSVGRSLSLASDRFRYGVAGGTVPVAELATDAPRLRTAERVIERDVRRVDETSGSFLLPPVSHALAQLRVQLGPARRDVVAAAGVATYVPGLLGLDGQRHYFLAFQDNAEARATGGLIGLYGVLSATEGHLTLSSVRSLSNLADPGGPARVLRAPASYLARYGSFDPAASWQNVNLSPNFPTVGSVITSLYPQSGGEPVDGVVAVDPMGLAALLELTGPVTVPGWPVPISPSNVAGVTMHRAYAAFPSESVRQNFLRRLVRTVFDKLTSLSLPDPGTLVADLSPAVRRHHIQVYSSASPEESYLGTLGMTGAVPPVASDSFMVTTQNAAGNKIDWYLHRSIDYQVALAPVASPGATATSAPSSAAVRGRVTVTLANAAPRSGQPLAVIGPYNSGLTAGEDRSYVTLYSPLQITAPTWQGAPAVLEAGSELGRSADSTFVDLPEGASGTLKARLVGRVRLLPGGWYEISLPAQPVVNPDRETVSITVAAGWRVLSVKGARAIGPNEVHARWVTASDHVIRVRIARAG